MVSLLTISYTSLQTTLHLTISAVQVSVPSHMWQHSDRQFTNRICSLVPKFQGENFYKNRAIVDEIKKLASRKGCTLSQIALAWVASQGMIAIPGTTKAKRVEENFASRNFELTEEEKQEMRSIIESAKPHGNRYAPAQQAMVGH